MVVEITALKDFKQIKKGDKRNVSRNVADILVKKGLAQIKGEELPKPEPKKRGPKPKN